MPVDFEQLIDRLGERADRYAVGWGDYVGAFTSALLAGQEPQAALATADRAQEQLAQNSELLRGMMAELHDGVDDVPGVLQLMNADLAAHGDARRVRQAGPGFAVENETPAVQQALQESLQVDLLEAGFTGVIRDSLGREFHYVNGIRVAGHQPLQQHLQTNPADRGVLHLHGSALTPAQADAYASAGSDRFGHALGKMTAKFAAALSPQPQTMSQLVAASGARGTFYAEINKLIKNGHVVKVGNGYALAPQHHAAGSHLIDPNSLGSLTPPSPTPPPTPPSPAPSPPTPGTLAHADHVLQNALQSMQTNPGHFNLFTQTTLLAQALAQLSNADYNTFLQNNNVPPWQAMTVNTVAQHLLQLTPAPTPPAPTPPAPTPPAPTPPAGPAPVNTNIPHLQPIYGHINTAAQNLAVNPSAPPHILRHLIGLSPTDLVQIAADFGVTPNQPHDPGSVARALIRKFTGKAQPPPRAPAPPTPPPPPTPPAPTPVAATPPPPPPPVLPQPAISQAYFDAHKKIQRILMRPNLTGGAWRKRVAAERKARNDIENLYNSLSAAEKQQFEQDYGVSASTPSTGWDIAADVVNRAVQARQASSPIPGANVPTTPPKVAGPASVATFNQQLQNSQRILAGKMNPKATLVTRHVNSLARILKGLNATELQAIQAAHGLHSANPAAMARQLVSGMVRTTGVQQHQLAPPNPKFTGTITDSLGRKYYYVNGVRVADAQHYQTQLRHSGATPTDYTHHRQLSPVQADAYTFSAHKEPDHVVSSRAAHIVSNNYDQLADTYKKQNGTFDAAGDLQSLHLDVDDWRHLFQGYDGTNASAVNQPAIDANNRLWDQMLRDQRGKGNNSVMIYGGGAGAGKSSSTGQFFTNTNYPLVLSSFSRNYGQLVGRINDIESRGYTAEYAYVDRHPEASWHGVVDRALADRLAGKPARTVPLKLALESNTEARDVALKLLQSHPNVKAHVVDNNHGPGLAKLITDRQQAITYLQAQKHNAKKLLQKLTDETLDRFERGEVPEDLARGLLGDAAVDGRLDALERAGKAVGPPDKPPVKLFNNPLESQTVKDYLSGAKTYRDVFHGRGAGHHDEVLQDLFAETNRGGLPNIADKKGIDDLVQKGGVELYRGLKTKGGYTAAQYADMMRAGEFYAGSGIYGNGMYSGDGGKQQGMNTARGYASGAGRRGGGRGGVVVRMVLDPKAKIIKDSDAIRESAKQIDHYRNEYHAGNLTRTEFDRLQEILLDRGRWAVLNGYDAIDCENHEKYIVVLNRNMLTMQDKNM